MISSQNWPISTKIVILSQDVWQLFRRAEETAGIRLKNTYKRRQYQRELEALLLAPGRVKTAWFCHFQGHLSGPYQRLAHSSISLASAVRYALPCDEKTDNDKKHDQILTFTPLKGVTQSIWSFSIHHWPMSKNQARNLSPGQQYRTGIYEQLKSAGTGLNYFVKYHDGDLNESMHHVWMSILSA